MCGVEQTVLSNQKYSQDSYLFYHLAREEHLMLGESFEARSLLGVHIH